VEDALIKLTSFNPALQADLTEKKVVDELAKLVADRIDVLVNNAGIVDKASVLEGGVQSINMMR
jgi:short-subunit dehydrogenase